MIGYIWRRKRLDRADRFGSNSHIGRGGWDDKRLIIMNNEEWGGNGMLPRANITEFMNRLNQDQSTTDLLEPFDDEDLNDD